MLLGSSLGCQIGARYALRHAAQVDAVVLSSPYGLAGQRRDRMRLARSEALLRLAAPWISRGRLRRELQQAAADESLITPRIVDSYYAALRTPDGRRVGQPAVEPDRRPRAPGARAAPADASPSWS